MNLLLKSMSVLLLLTMSISAKPASELSILNLDHLPSETTDILALKEQIRQQDPDIICIFKNVIDFIKNSYEGHFDKDFPFVLQPENNKCVILSKYELSHFKLHDLGPDNTLLELASHEIPSLILNAHLPYYSQEQLDTLKSYLLATTPYVSLHMTGDLADNKYLAKNYEYLILPCVKRELEVSVEGNKKKEAEVKLDARFSSDDRSKNLELEAKYSQDQKGESNASAKATFKIEY